MVWRALGRWSVMAPAPSRLVRFRVRPGAWPSEGTRGSGRARRCAKNAQRCDQGWGCAARAGALKRPGHRLSTRPWGRAMELEQQELQMKRGELGENQCDEELEETAKERDDQQGRGKRLMRPERRARSVQVGRRSWMTRGLRMLSS
mmetsp:Transcript_13489/g.36194  ORF Transcript_13489/g.36194 Transcript_13489/m.36194 type:complete len:147 (+) Transcript_13489:124-564(+)